MLIYFSLVLVIKTSDIIVIVCRKLLITKIYGGCFVWLIFAPDTSLYTLHYSWTGLVLTGNNGQQQATTRYQDAKPGVESKAPPLVSDF